MFRESDLEWEFMFKVGIVDFRLVEEFKNVFKVIKVEDNVFILVGEVVFVSSDVWKDVMEEDSMFLEFGFVFFLVSLF